MLKAFYNSIVIPFRDFIYTPLCFVCNERLENDGERVCRECWSSFPLFNVGDPMWLELKKRFDQEGAVSDFLSCFYFEQEGKLQQVIHLLKYQGMKSMGVMLGREIGERIAKHLLFSTADALIPVPLHKLKERERGYNQCEFLCKGIAEVTVIPIKANFISRTKYTKSQTQLNFEERRENVGDAFAVPPASLSEIQRKTLILVDDVITTGSTINACAQELVAAGAKSVLAVSAAIAL